MRKATNKILEMVEEQVLDPKEVVLMCLKWMSEEQVQDMARVYELFEEEEVEEEEEEEEEEEPASYILFAGETKDSLYPLKAFRDKDEAIADAKETVKLGCPCAEVCYMPEDDVDTNEVVWSNC
jgi:hypothetical protein